jgi:DNA-binding SARP family transcriptional activator
MTADGTALELRLLGRPQLTWADRPLDLRARKPLALVLALALRDDGLPKATLAELLWGPGRRANLRSALYQLRRDAGAEAWLEEDAERDRLRLHADSDLARFERRLAAGDAAGALAAWPAAALASGPRTALLAGFDVPGAPAFHDWLDGERERVFAQVRDAAVTHADALADDGAIDAALALLEAVSDDDPYDEELQRRIMSLA